MYSDSSQKVFSYYQIGGIHGRPYVSWNQSPGETTREYCEHGTTIFAPWHRPYVALVEQVIQEYAIKIAASYTVNKDDWKKAAVDLRQPFWDWSLPNPMPPDELVFLDKVEITRADGKRVKVENPLLEYKFHNSEDTITFGEWATTPKTVRQPRSLGPTAETDFAALKEELKKNRTNDTRRLLLEVHDWNSFATAAVDRSSDDVAFTNSLEAIHGSVHNSVGGMGHMGAVPAAGFDPIFFMHHCQVDRLLSLWSALNPGQWAPSDTVNKDLLPFWNSPSTFWTSAHLKLHHSLNYNYPEFKDFQGNEEQLKEHIRKIVENLYPIQRGLSTETFPAWTVRIRCKQYEAGHSFSVPITIDRDGTGPLLVGSGDFFVNSDPEGCANCLEQAATGLETQTFVHLNSAFASVGLSDGPDERKVEHLKKNLHWRAEKVNREAVRLPSLQIMVMKNAVQLRSGRMPTVGEPQYFPEITEGRKG